MAEILIQAMQGCGDSIHTRAIVKYYLSQGDRIWITTCWPQIFADLYTAHPGKLKFIRTDSALRTQKKNATRSAEYWTTDPLPRLVTSIRVSYRPEQVRELGGVLQAMLASAGVPQGCDDFRFAARIGRRSNTMIYRPLVDRSEWGGCNARNPDQWAYGSLGHSLHNRLVTFSIADLDPGKEWIAGADIPAHEKYHKGELGFEQLCERIGSAGLAFCSPGFVAPLAQALGTPVVVVFGGYEDARSFSAGAKYTPTLNIEPITPCNCFQHNHSCLQNKQIDYAAAQGRLDDFVEEHCNARLLPPHHSAQERLGPTAGQHGFNSGAASDAVS